VLLLLLLARVQINQLPINATTQFEQYLYLCACLFVLSIWSFISNAGANQGKYYFVESLPF